MENSSIDIVIKSEVENVNMSKGEYSSILTRVNAGYFTICVSFGAQALLLHALIHHQSKIINIPHLHLHAHILSSLDTLMMWLSLCTLTLISCLYTLRCIFHLTLVKAECSHGVASNFLFGPWISWLLLLRAASVELLSNILPHEILLWVFLMPLVILDVKIYGQWFTTERRSLSVVATPTSHLPMVGNFVGAWAAAGMGWNETAICLFSIGLVHYVVVFITLYQRVSGSGRFRAVLRPVSFLFFATPSTACLAWSDISGCFGVPCKMLFFLSLFLLASLMCRPGYFKKSMKKFSMAWWVYSFPLSFVALASVNYAEEVKTTAAAAGLMFLLSTLSLFVFLGLLLLTALNSHTLLLHNDHCLNFS